MDFLIFLGGMLAILAVFVIAALRRGLQMKKLAEAGYPAQARIVEKARVRAGKGQSSTTLTYEFQDAFGNQHRRRIHVSETVFSQHQEGDNLDVVYLLDKPRINGPKYMVDQVAGVMASRGHETKR